MTESTVALESIAHDTLQRRQSPVRGLAQWDDGAKASVRSAKVDGKSLVILQSTKQCILLLQRSKGAVHGAGVEEQARLAPVASEGRRLRAQVEVRPADQLVASPRGGIGGRVLQEREVLTIVVTDERHGTAPADEPRHEDIAGFVILGKQRQTLVTFTPDKEVQRVIAK